MRIAVNTRVLLKNQLEGIGWFTYEVLQRMVEQHPEHEFIFLFDRPFDPDFIFSENVTPVILPPPARHPILFYLWFDWAIPWALKKYQADVFLSPDGFCSLRTKIPTILIIHDVAYHHFPEQISKVNLAYYRFFVPRFLKKARKILTVSAFSRQDLINIYNTPPEKISLTCNGARSHFKPVSPSIKEETRRKYTKGNPYLIYIGAVHPRKNVHRLIEAFDLFKHSNDNDLKLLIVGRFAWQTGEVKSAYDAAKHQDDIIFLGYMPDETLPNLLASAEALVYVSIFEGFGMPILEAFYCDVPVITSTISSMPEVAGEGGVLVNPFDVNAIAKGIQKVVSDEGFRQKLMENGRLQRQKFTWQIAALTVYEAVQSVR